MKYHLFFLLSDNISNTDIFFVKINFRFNHLLFYFKCSSSRWCWLVCDCAPIWHCVVASVKISQVRVDQPWLTSDAHWPFLILVLGSDIRSFGCIILLPDILRSMFTATEGYFGNAKLEYRVKLEKGISSLA